MTEYAKPQRQRGKEKTTKLVLLLVLLSREKIGQNGIRRNENRQNEIRRNGTTPSPVGCAL